MSNPTILVSCAATLNVRAAQYAIGILLQLVGVSYRFATYSEGQHLDAGGGEVVLSYGPSRPTVGGAPHVHVQSSRFFSDASYLKRTSIPQKLVPAGETYIFPEHSCGGHGLEPQVEGQCLEVGQDIFASAFVLLTNYEEFVKSGAVDTRGRRYSKDSLLGRHGLLHRPLVNEYAGLLQEWVRASAPGVSFNEGSWHGKSFALALTRDVDSVCKYPPLSYKRLLKDVAAGRVGKGARRIREEVWARKIKNDDPHNNLSEILAWEEGLNIRSSIYLLCSDLAGDANYKAEVLVKTEPLVDAGERGWEIGFHPGFRTHADAFAFFEEKGVLDRCVRWPTYGGRQHGLRFQQPHTWRLWEDAGFKYDSTIGFADHEGFKSGICHPYRPFDLIENREMDIWELPLTVMDCTLDRYRNLGPAAAGEVLSNLLKVVSKYRGVMVLLWHNSYFGRRNVGEYHDKLKNMVMTALGQSAYVGTAISVLQAWEANVERCRRV